MENEIENKAELEEKKLEYISVDKASLPDSSFFTIKEICGRIHIIIQKSKHDTNKEGIVLILTMNQASIFQNHLHQFMRKYRADYL